MKVRFIGLVKIIHFDAVHAVLKHSSCVQKTMTEREAKLLQMLCKKKNELVRRDIILSRLWDTEDDFFASRSLDVLLLDLENCLLMMNGYR